MGWILCLGHAGLAALVLPFSLAAPGLRRRALEIASATGFLLGVGLVVAGAIGAEGWRSVGFEPASAVPAGFAAAAAWVLMGALGAERARVEEAALTGVAATGLTLAAGGRYVVPALIFWLCSSAAVAALAAGSRRVWPVLALSDAAVCAAAVLHVWREDTWATGSPAGDPVLWVLALAALVRGGAYVRADWAVLGTRAAPAAPLLAGGAVVLAARAGRAEPWLALLVLASAVAALARGLTNEGGLTPRLVATWPVALAVSVCFVTPGHAAVAGAASVLAVSAAALWPFSAGRGGFERGLLVAAVPLTAGFAMVAAGAVASFQRATGAQSTSLPWALVAALLPGAFAGGVVLGGRVARSDVEELVPEAVLATWLLLAASAFVGLAPGALGGPDAGLGASGGVFGLHLAALTAGVAAALAVRRWGVVVERAPAPRTIVRLDPLSAPPRVVAGATLVVAALTAGAAAWLTVAGLRVGFL